jgi:hypothetical protein
VRFLSPAKHRSVDDIASPPACGFSSGRPDCVAEDAVRSKTVSRPDLPCNLRFAGRFSQNAGRANPISCKSSNGFNNLEEVLATTRSRERLRVLQGRFWEIAGRSSVKLRMLAGLAQIPLRVDMVYWPTPGARLCRREALPLRSSAPYQSRAAAGVGTSIAMQSKAPRASKCVHW